MPMQIKNAFENLSISTFIRQSTWLSGCLHSPTPPPIYIYPTVTRHKLGTENRKYLSEVALHVAIQVGTWSSVMSTAINSDHLVTQD